MKLIGQSIIEHYGTTETCALHSVPRINTTNTFIKGIVIKYLFVSEHL